MSLCELCITGVRHEGTAEGKWEKINGVDCYVATPTTDYDKSKVLIYLSDVFGPRLINAQLLADDFARNGFRTIMPDLFDSDAAPEILLTNPAAFDLDGFFNNHPPARAKFLVDRVIAALKADGDVKKIGTTGYCYGARVGVDLALDGTSSVTVIAHPSLLQVPVDFERYKAVSHAPLLIHSCTVDHLFPAEAQAAADAILGDGKFAPGYERMHWEGCQHGFGVRGDLTNPAVKAGKEGSFKATAEFLLKHL
ncbi:hypothetical protein EIP91_006449 [Steccherinum ochraceum]|uniref:Dienelactone hydrolase domain-containing protein n=1 Tax=Steccherinum ochraceum TaxID=92696 RepID=A0A4R0R5N4_9APHY|nr:hypothetical protein EIP91_006449 [Steccherinum ochraceum]